MYFGYLIISAETFQAVKTLIRGFLQHPTPLIWVLGQHRLRKNSVLYVYNIKRVKFLLVVVEYVVCLFVLGFNVSLTLFQSYCDGICRNQESH